MKYKVGDRVRIKSIDWYNKNKDADSYVHCGDRVFDNYMSVFCGSVVTIGEVSPYGYDIREDMHCRVWTDEMIEGLVEEENTLSKNAKLVSERFAEYVNPSEFKHSQDTIMKMLLQGAINLPEGYQFVDENGNVINATKIVLEKKHNDKLKLESTKTVREYWSEYARIYIEIYDDEPNECVLTHLYTLEDHRQKGYGRQALIEAESIAKELGCHTTYLKVETDSWMHQWYLRMGYKWYKNVNKEYTWLSKNLTSIEEKKKEYPKTYEECIGKLPINWDGKVEGYKCDLLITFQKLLICRDAYWKIAGEEMGLGKPWELSIGTPIYYIYYNRTVGTIKNDYADDIQGNIILAFPTAEMRDAFYENFKEEIETVKELL